MFISIGKPSTFLLLLMLTAVLSPAAQAQIKKPERDFSAGAQTGNSEIESDAATDDAARLPERLPPVVRKENDKIISGVEGAKDDWRLSFDGDTETNEFAYRFRQSDAARRLNFELPPRIGEKRFLFPPLPVNAAPDDDKRNGAPDAEDAADIKPQGFNWRAATQQSLMFLAVQHGYAFTQPKTREAIKGKFWKDYVESVKSLHGWADGGRFFTNYIAHPMQGSLTGFIYVQNDPNARQRQFGDSKEYWTSRLKAMAWSAAWSTQFEIGPVSQASIGNVGLKGKQTYIDIVITPTVGTALLIGEDAVDRLITKRIERYTNNFYVKIFSRMLLSPTRNFSNLVRFKAPWHRDRPVAR